ncbi:Glu/Leu/Phe/Val family dehydrogenase [Streptosporangium saharense]|uniref:Glu/Leu/Phe/Val family dehydrogenase n=1 Tax=Streptosporangium saharense TaxID=1706840 RepID=UPI0034265FD9
MTLTVPSTTPATALTGHDPLRKPPLDAALLRLDETALLLGLDDGLRAMLATPRRSLTVSVPVRREDGRTGVVQGFRVQHSTVLGPPRGGTRFAPSADLQEVTALAMVTTWKHALAGVPYGGARGGVRVDPASLEARELERVTRRYVNEIMTITGSDGEVPAPDPDSDERLAAWMADSHSAQPGYPAPGPVPGEAVATAFGVAAAVLRATPGAPRGRTVAVHGSGETARLTASHLAREGCRVVAASGGEALGLDVDVLVLAAPVTVEQVRRVRAPLVAEAVDGPLSPAADLVLAEAGTVVVPDVLTGAGGVLASRPALAARCFDTVAATAAERGITLRQAAWAVAVGRVAQAHGARF